jgi:membrane dipeptidase
MKIAHALILFTAVLPLHAQTTSKTASVTKQKDPLAVHQAAIVIDTHADTTQRMLDEGYDLTEPLKGGYVNFESARKGNLGAEFFSIWVDPAAYPNGHEARRTLELIDAVYQQAAKHPQQMRMAFSPEDIRAAHREHKLAALMGIEGGHSIENSLGLLRDYYRLGVRYMTLTWSNSNGWADSSGDIDDPKVPHTKDGLSDFGKDVVYEMNRLGMMVDISHVSDTTFYRTLIISRAPVIASHSSARALCNAPRNMDDNMLHAVGQYGGVVMVNFYSSFLSEDYRKAAQAMQPAIDQAVAAADLPKITQALMARGYSAEDMNKILGGNFLRVFEKVQEVSRQLQSESRPRIDEKQPFDKK